MRHKLSLFLVAAAAVAASGCQTYERRIPGTSRIEYVQAEPGAERKTEQQLLEATEKDPESPRVWFALGDYYELHWDYERAAIAFEKMNALVEKAEQKHQTRYTGGHYNLGRIYGLIGRYDLAISHLEQVVALEPKDVRVASLNSHFVESHYLLGAIYHKHKMWKEARKHFERCIDVSGGNQLMRTRVEPWLYEIRREDPQ